MKTVIITLLTVSSLLAQAPTIGNTAPASSSAGGTCATLGGDVTGTCAANTAVKINNGSVPASATVVGTNSSSQPVVATTTGTGTTVPLSVSPAFTGTPTAPTPVSTDKSTTIATTSFVQGLFSSLNQAVSVEAATVTTLPANTYANGTSGVGATLTGNSNGALAAIDGYTASVGDRLLINNQASALQNGVYTLTTLGNGGAPYVLTRATDFNTVTQINTSGAIPVLNGTANNNTLWVLNTSITAIGTGAPTAAINYVLGAASPFPTLSMANASSTGTTLNKLVKKTGSPSTAVINNTADVTGAFGICLGNCGTTGSATIGASPGAVYACVFDGATTAGDWVQISPTVNGDCHDSGVPTTSTPTNTGELLGSTQTTNAAGGTFAMLWGSLDIVPAAIAAAARQPYSAAATGLTTLSVLAATHLQGINAIAQCFNNASPAVAVDCYYTRNGSGDIVFTWAVAFTGTVEILSTGAGPTGPAGPAGSGITSIATTSPITGGTITTTGTIACATCVAASSPGVGIAHFAGSTQTVTSSAVNLAGGSSEITGALPCANMPALTGGVTSSAGSCATTNPHGLAFPIGAPGGIALTTASVSQTLTIPFACTITAYNLAFGAGDTGTITVKFWKVATGTAIPTSGNSINTSGVGIATGTAIHSATVSDFTTTTVTANDMIAMAVTAVSGSPVSVTGVLQCQ